MVLPIRGKVRLLSTKGVGESINGDVANPIVYVIVAAPYSFAHSGADRRPRLYSIKSHI